MRAIVWIYALWLLGCDGGSAERLPVREGRSAWTFIFTESTSEMDGSKSKSAMMLNSGRAGGHQQEKLDTVILQAFCDEGKITMAALVGPAIEEKAGARIRLDDDSATAEGVRTVNLGSDGVVQFTSPTELLTRLAEAETLRVEYTQSGTGLRVAYFETAGLRDSLARFLGVCPNSALAPSPSSP